MTQLLAYAIWMVFAVVALAGVYAVKLSEIRREARLGTVATEPAEC